MHSVTISEAAANPFAADLQQDLKETGRRGGRVYFTHITVDPSTDGSRGEGEFTLVTTSKDVHLGLGRMDWRAQRLLVGMLEWEFEHASVRQLILRLSGEERALLVTRTEDAVAIKDVAPLVTYTLAPTF